MRTVRNITVAVDPKLYHQTRKLAAEYDTTVTDMVRFLLLILPEAVKAARYPGGTPQFGLAVARAASAPPANNPPAPSPQKSEISPVNANNQVSIQQLAGQQPASVQDKYFSIPMLKVLISKALRANS